ncbi:MAG: polysaccharide export protein [Desulfobacula sp.]|jgi:polysaccharide export outer membrane protein|nr:polysaccharide export protein [Desulfobacula sp.]
MSKYYPKNLLTLFCFLVFCIFITAEKGLSEEKAVKNFKEYKIGIGDVLKIDTWKEADLSFAGLTVRNDGKLTLPLLDDLQAEGRTTMELKKTIQEKLSEYVEAPTVTVTLVNPGSQKYYILGEVGAVGEYPLIKKLTIVQAFALAKGFSEWAAKDEIILVRKGQGQEKLIKIDYDDITDGNLKEDILLQADDIIIVP